MKCSNKVLKCAFHDVYADFVIYKKNKKGRHNGYPLYEILVASVFNRSNSLVRSFAANCRDKNIEVFDQDTNKYEFAATSLTDLDAYFSVLNLGYERVTHGYLINPIIKDMIFVKDDSTEIKKRLYNYLMERFDYPLLLEWMDYFVAELKRKKAMEEISMIEASNEGITINLYNEEISLSNLNVYDCSGVSAALLEEIITSGLSTGRIKIANNPQRPLLISSLDSYFANYGSTIVSNLEKQLEPLTGVKGTVEELALKNMNLFGQQASMVNGLVALLDKSSYAIINQGMGCGKTIQGASTVEAYFVKKYMQRTGEDIKQVYSDLSKINYRVVIMCPGHLVEKWAKECRQEIPGAKVIILNNLEQLITIKNNGRERNGREFFVIGKDFCKLSYSFSPVPTKFGSKRLPSFKCRSCNSYLTNKDLRTGHCQCGEREFNKIYESEETYEGMLCPECEDVMYEKDSNLSIITLKPEDFADKNSRNDSCCYCGSKLWQPRVKNLGGNLKNSKWYKVSHYTNKSKKLRTTSWVLKGSEQRLYKHKGLQISETEVSKDVKNRKIAPSIYMKKQLKGYFDIAIFDEVHVFKGGDTAQGFSMHTLVGISKKQLCLTGTIAGGMASHLFYLLYRLDPRRMNKKGYKYTDLVAFASKYGTVETLYELNSKDSDVHNKNSRGRKVSQPAMKPGISPLIFRDFLMDKAVFLDLSDMSNYLPTFTEEVVRVPMDDNILLQYKNVITTLKGYGQGINPITSSMLQFSLSYPDKPYNYDNIIDPKTGTIVCSPPSYDLLDNELLPKEEKLVELIRTEMMAGRNAFVYAEFTGDGSQNITKRLKTVIEMHCGLEGKVAILESSKPKATEREAWIHKMAQKGFKVFITNPRCVETGLDFIFRKDSVLYNFPTIIFYQLGYNLFTLWQASRRSYRLIQVEPCKVIYMAYKGTIQEEVIKIMAEKQVATAAIQGKFSSEGLMAMSNGVDARVRLVNALLNNQDDYDDGELEKMFTSMNQANSFVDDAFIEKVKGNHNYYELIGINHNSEVIEEKTEVRKTQVFDLLTFLFNNDGLMSSNVKKVENVPDPKEHITFDITLRERKKCKYGQEQLSLF